MNANKSIDSLIALIAGEKEIVENCVKKYNQFVESNGHGVAIERAAEEAMYDLGLHVRINENYLARSECRDTADRLAVIKPMLESVKAFYLGLEICK